MSAKGSFVSAISAAALLALAACHGGSDKGGGWDADRDVYVAGSIMDAQGKYTATLWENGAPRQLSANYSEALSVCASGDDVYVAGWEFFDDRDWNFDEEPGLCPVLWVNGAPRYLPSENPYWAQALSVHVSDGGVCVAGYEGDVHMGDDLVAKIWVDGHGSRLGTGEARSVFVAGGDVHVAGLERTDAVRAALWKGGMPQALATANGQAPSLADSVFVSGGTVYVAGEEFEDNAYGGTIHAVLWENGAARRIGGQDGSEAHSVCVSGGDVYVAGVEFVGYWPTATVWRNGVPQRLDGSRALSVFVSPSGDVYAAGTGAYGLRPRLWKNGAALALGGETIGSTANSVFVVERAK